MALPGRTSVLPVLAMSEGRQSPELQREVQRLLGRCMLRLQQYELLMKALLASHELAGTVETLEAQQTARVERLADKSLGTLVKALFESYVVVEGQAQRDLIDDSKVPVDRISMAFRFSIAMPEERRAETKAAVDELVSMRNDLVHHLVERFDLWSDEGCQLASDHLMQCYERVDRHYAELRQWAEGMENARALSASFVNSDAYRDMVVNGIAPDGSVDWPFTGIVRVLREGLATTGSNGWAPLDEVCSWISQAHSEQTPEKYGRRSWPQVLSESGLFELQYRVGDEGSKRAWFRERPPKAN